MDNGMVSSEEVGVIQSSAFGEGYKVAGNKFISYIVGIRDFLKNLAEDRTLPMDVNVHDLLWQEIQSIDHDIKTKFKG